MPHLRIDDVDLYYERAGQGPPLVFVHGLGSSTRDWEAQVAHFASGFGVVTLDLRGHGRSARPPGPYSIAGFAADVAGLLRALGLGPAHVVGLSMGGMVALQLALDAPELVRSLAVVNSAPEVVVKTWRERLRLWQRLLLVRLFGMRAAGWSIGRRLFPKPEQAALRRTFVERWAENDPQAYLASVRAIVGWSVRERLGAIAQPTLVLTSDADYTPVAAKQAWAGQMPNAEVVVVEDARHGLPAERPDAFNDALQAFLSPQLQARPASG